MKRAAVADKIFGLVNKIQGRMVVIRRRELEEALKAPNSHVTDKRTVAAELYLTGEGLEIGALHRPLLVPEAASVRYVDRLSLDDLRKHYPELAELDLVPVDVIDDGEKLATVEPNSQDFIIANHFLEHCQDPIQTIENFLKVLKKDGYLYLIIPDKRFTFDSERPITTFDHLLNDYNGGAEKSKNGHFEEWIRLVKHVQDPRDVERETAKLIEEDYSIHYHVWALGDMMQFFLALQREVGLKFEIELVLKNGEEIIFVLQKN